MTLKKTSSTLKSGSNLAKNPPKCRDNSNLKKKHKKRENRSEYPDFYKRHVQHIIASNQLCENCGDRLKANATEIAHIIAKSTNPEVATNDDNIIYLCGLFSRNQCHAKFDSGGSNRVQMACFGAARKKFEKIKEKIVNITPEFLTFVNTKD